MAECCRTNDANTRKRVIFRRTRSDRPTAGGRHRHRLNRAWREPGI